MLDRRQFFLGLAAIGALTAAPADALSAQKKKKTKQKKKIKKKFVLDPKFRPQSVKYRSGQKPGTIIIDTGARFLYLVTGRNSARRYGVGVGRDALAWSGIAVIGAKKEWPEWRPTDEMIQREPEKYAQYVNGMPGGKGNPLGARALYLFDGGYDTFYRIHGTTQPSSIGTASSNGCIRMTNDSVIDLYKRVPIGTKVIVM